MCSSIHPLNISDLYKLTFAMVMSYYVFCNKISQNQIGSDHDQQHGLNEVLAQSNTINLITILHWISV